MGNNAAWAGLGQALQTGGDAYSKAKAAAEAQRRLAEQDAMTKTTFDRTTEEQTPSFDLDAIFPGAPKGIKTTRSEAVRGFESKANKEEARNNADKVRKDAEKSKAGDKVFSAANQLRDEYNQLSKPIQIIAPMYKNIKASAETKDPTAATDMGLIFSYMKILDPNSTVREGEYASAARAGSFGDSVKVAYSRLDNGQMLTPEQRVNFLASAKQTFKSANDIQGQHTSRYTDLASRGGVDPKNVIYDYTGGMLDEPVSETMPTSSPGASPKETLAQMEARRAAAMKKP